MSEFNAVVPRGSTPEGCYRGLARPTATGTTFCFLRTFSSLSLSPLSLNHTMPVPPLAANLQRRSPEGGSYAPAARNPLPSPTLSDPELVQIVTTTLYTSPTIIVAAPPTSTPIPVAAIAGGTVGGVALAIIAVLVWKWWGKSIMKRELEVRRKKVGVCVLRGFLSY